MLRVMRKKKKEAIPKEPPYWYKDVKELVWWILGIVLIILVSTRM